MAMMPKVPGGELDIAEEDLAGADSIDHGTMLRTLSRRRFPDKSDAARTAERTRA